MYDHCYIIYIALHNLSCTIYVEYQRMYNPRVLHHSGSYTLPRKSGRLS